MQEALAIAIQKGLDLVEIAPQAKPPVCRIMDFGKFRFELKKKQKEAKKKQTVIHLKELTMGPSIEAHDYETKLKQARKFMEKGDKVKFTVRFRGRQIVHKERGQQVLEKFSADLADIAQTEKPPVFEGRKLMLVLAPLKK